MTISQKRAHQNMSPPELEIINVTPGASKSKRPKGTSTPASTRKSKKGQETPSSKYAISSVSSEDPDFNAPEQSRALVPCDPRLESRFEGQSIIMERLNAIKVESVETDYMETNQALPSDQSNREMQEQISSELDREFNQGSIM